VLVITAADDMRTVQHALGLGADGYLVKPVTQQTLVSRLAVLLPEFVKSSYVSSANA
jgi:response regulator of citrate/malate metabolism